MQAIKAIILQDPGGSIQEKQKVYKNGCEQYGSHVKNYSRRMRKAEILKKK